MKTIKRILEIKAPVQRVYDFLAQPSNLPGIWPHMQSVSNVVDGIAGTHDFDWEFKMGGLTFKGRAKVEEARPGKLVRYRNQGGIPSTFLWTYEGLNGSGTRLTLDVEYTIPTPILGKIAEVIVVKMNERDLDTMLANLKDIVESGVERAGVAARPH